MKVERTVVNGAPRHISTNYIERQNLTLRMSQRRMTRFSNGFSKNTKAIARQSLYTWLIRIFCRVHEALRITPAMQLGTADYIWGISELIQAALSEGAQMQVNRALAAFRVI